MLSKVLGTSDGSDVVLAFQQVNKHNPVWWVFRQRWKQGPMGAQGEERPHPGGLDEASSVSRHSGGQRGGGFAKQEEQCGQRYRGVEMLTGLGHANPGDSSGKESACQCRRRKRHGVRSLGWEDPLEEEMATHSSILA